MHDDMPGWEEVPANADDMPPLEDDMPGLEAVPANELEHHDDMPALEDSSTDDEVEPPDAEYHIIMAEVPPEMIGDTTAVQDPHLMNRMTAPRMNISRMMVSHIWISGDAMPTESPLMTRFLPYVMARTAGPHAAQ